MKETRMPPVHAANLVANSGKTAYVIVAQCSDIYIYIYIYMTLYNALST